MYFFICLTSLQLLTGSFAAPESLVAQSFKKLSDIVVNPPTEFIKVTYQSVSINLGTVVQPLQTLAQPEVSYEADSQKLYTLAFLGPDLPPSIIPPLSQFLHWLVVDIPGNNISKGETIASYFQPTPYPDGLPYIFLVYEQNGPLNITTNQKSFILSRPQFSIDEFASKYKIKGPIAGNYMRVSYLELGIQAVEGVSNLVSNTLKSIVG